MFFTCFLVAAAFPTRADDTEEPKGPAATAEVQALLDEAERLRREKNAEAALAAADRGLAAAHEANDLPGAAFSRRARARALQALDRLDEAQASWQEVESAWESQGAIPERIEALGALALLFARARDSEAVIGVVDRAVALAKKEQTRPLAALARLKEATQQLVRFGQLAPAGRLARAALAMAQEYAPDSLVVASALNNLGVVVMNQDDLESAHDYHRQALEIRERIAPGSLEVAASLSNLGVVARKRGELKAARDYYRRALVIDEKLAPGSLGMASSLSNLGVVAQEQGDFESARDYHLRALEIREKRAPGSFDVAMSRGNLGILALRQGDFESAGDYLRRTLEIHQKHAPGSLGVAHTLDILGVLASHQGDLESARNYHRQALEIQEEHAPDSLASAASLTNLGSVAWAQGDVEAARDYMSRALAIEEKLAPGSLDVARSLTNHGVVASGQGDLDSALEFYRRAQKIYDKRAPGSLAAAANLNGLGLVARDRGDLDSARDHLRRALEIQEKQAPGSLAVVPTLTSLGLVAKDEGDLPSSRDYHRRALEIQEGRAPGSLASAVVLNNLGVVAFNEGDLDSARGYFIRAWSTVRLQGRVVVGQEAWLGFSQKYAAYAADLILSEVQLRRADRALVVLDESRAVGLLELFQRRGLRQSAAPELWNAYKKAERHLDQLGEQLADASTDVFLRERDLADLVAQGMTEKDLAGTRENLSRAVAAREEALADYTQARVAMQSRLAEVRRSVPGLEAEPLSIEAARTLLPASSVFIAFSVGDEATTAIVVSSDSEVSARGYPIDLTAEQLAKRVDFVRDRLGAGRVERGLALAEKSRLENASRSLFRKLFPDEVRPVLEAAERVVISPDGPLWDLPFAALDMGADEDRSPSWLALEKSLSYAPSLTTLAHAKRHTNSSEEASVLVVGDPMPRAHDGNGKKSSDGKKTGERTRLFPNGVPPEPLPGAREEARRLAKLYESEALIGLEATENVVRARMPKATIVHLATHGYFHPTQPMSSGVLLAPTKEKAATGTDADGALQAWEILSSLDLRADLVVLSACETGLGRAVRGEGLVGLTRALQAAGANSVVATHWKVADDSTTELMVSFHEKLRAGARKDDALRQAMREVAGRKETSHPYFWAAFFLSGGSE